MESAFHLDIQFFKDVGITLTLDLWIFSKTAWALILYIVSIVSDTELAEEGVAGIADGWNIWAVFAKVAFKVFDQRKVLRFDTHPLSCVE